jgi:hypothetical protein
MKMSNTDNHKQPDTNTRLYIPHQSRILALLADCIVIMKKRGQKNRIETSQYLQTPQNNHNHNHNNYHYIQTNETVEAKYGAHISVSKVCGCNIGRNEDCHDHSKVREHGVEPTGP